MSPPVDELQRVSRQQTAHSTGLDLAEKAAVISTIAAIVIVPLFIWWINRAVISRAELSGARVFNLTGLGSQGRWTVEEVNGFNYWWKSFPRAEVHVEPNELVVLRLQSGDVTHAFYAPTLNVGPVYIEPGHVEVVTFRAREAGVHYYYCMSICGDCHYFMRGMIVVGSAVAASELPEQSKEWCAHTIPDPADTTLHDRGRYLFQTMGCIACHGEEGRGRVFNPNYVKNTVPALNLLSKSLSLSGPEDAEILTRLIAEGKRPEQMEAMSTGFERQSIVIGKYRAIRDVIKMGRTPARTDTASFVPPLAMPSWREKLSEHDIDALLVYLLQHQAWEDD